MAGTPPLRDRWIDWVLRRHRAILVVAVLITAFAASLASKLEVDSDLRRLLPRDHEVVVALESIEETFGSTGSVNVVVRGEAEARHAYSDALAKHVAGHELLGDVDYRLPSDFFLDHALYYLADEELEELRGLIDAWLHAETCAAEPDLCLTEPKEGAKEELEDFIETKRKESLARTGFEDLYEREGTDANVILLRPVEPASSLEFCKQISDEMRAAANEVLEREGAPWSGKITVNLVGPYISKADEHAIVQRDTIRAGAVALLGVMLVLYGLFRSARAVLILLVPLTFGVVWSLAATYVLIGDLNVMTSMISTVVMGAGIDAGIHFFLRARKERREHENDEAIRLAFRNLVVPLLVASSTTVGAFTIMATSDFPAFAEFGVISAMGVALCLAAMVTVLPALSCLVGIKRAKPPRLRRGVVSQILLARPGLVLAILGALTVFSAIEAPNVGFAYNARELQSDYSRQNSEEDVALISEIFGRDIHAGILVRQSLEEARATLDEARASRQALLERGEESVVAELFAAPDLMPDPSIVPAERERDILTLLEPSTIEAMAESAQVDATELLARAREVSGDEFDGSEWEESEGTEDDWDDGAAGSGAEGARIDEEDAANLIRMLSARPFGIDDLPHELLHAVRTDDGAYGVFAYPAFDAADMRKGVDFREETAQYLSSGELFVGETTVYAAMFTMLREEAPVVLGMAALLVALLVYWQLRSVRQAILTLLPLALALLWLVGAMAMLDLEFTLFNLPILPAILGIGVDNGVYLTDKIRRTKGEADGLLLSLVETGSAIMAAMATTAIGFAAFMVADSAGVRGIGEVAVLGIVLAALGATLVLPSLSGLARDWAAKRR
ncbi:MAG: efflux RND transporter permease subunit [Nannocystaceae bacterium]|nr:MMPL family transporter [bacterium]